MKRNKKLLNYLTFVIVGIMLISFFTQPMSQKKTTAEINYTEFNQQLQKNNLKNLEVKEEPGNYGVSGEFKTEYTYKVGETEKKAQKFYANIPNDPSAIKDIKTQMEKNNLKVNVKPYKAPVNILGIILWIAIIGGMIYSLVFFSKMMKQQNKTMNFGKGETKKSLNSNVKFSDVAGYEEEKQELIEIVDFLKNPLIYTQMGARVPKGILLVGPPGTGKTLLAKAVAGEAGVNFIMQSGSEFVEMFVGVGAGRARKLFADAKKMAPCIIFIDEIDAIGGRRGGSGHGGGHDEKEQTLNQILIEMDGFLGNSGVVVMGATNRADVLDPALLRPGRFDRQVQVNLPNLKEREAILKLHISRRKVTKEIDVQEIAKNTSGFSGAQLENVINEAAIVAVRRKKKEINREDVSEAIDRVIMGPAKKTRKYTEEDKKIIAYHETGHVIVGMDLEDADKIQKVTIIPRGNAGGYASFAPKEDRFNYTKKHLEEKIIGLLGGRAGEEIYCQVQTAGVHNDIERATKIARSMVVEYGMSDLGLYQYQHLGDDQYGYTNKRYSEETAQKIDKEINKILDEAYKKAIEIMNRRHEDVVLIAEALIEVEILERSDIDYLLEHKKLPDVIEDEKYTDEEIKEIRDAEQKLKEELKKAQEKAIKENKKQTLKIKKNEKK